jgi:hypothetical protein
MKKKIILGDVPIAKWEKGDSLYSDWMKEEKEYIKEIAKNKPDDIILPSGDYVLQIDYPLGNPFMTRFVVEDGGMTREQLVILVIKSYKKIYKNEDKYGIWGHNIGDLILCSAEVDGNIITLGVDS